MDSRTGEKFCVTEIMNPIRPGGHHDKRKSTYSRPDIPNGMAGVATVRALTLRVFDFKADSTGYDYGKSF